MSFAAVLAALDLLDSPTASGAEVAAALHAAGVDEVEVVPLRGERGGTDVVRAVVPGTRGPARRDTRVRQGADGPHVIGARARGLCTDMKRQRDTGARMDALVRGADWAQMGTSEPTEAAGVYAFDDAVERNPA